jgi:hypothetical protein
MEMKASGSREGYLPLPCPTAGGGRGLDRRRLIALLLAAAGWGGLGSSALAASPIEPESSVVPNVDSAYPLYDEAVSRVLPADGYHSRIALELSVTRLVEYGAIDRGKFLALYENSDVYQKDFSQVLDQPANETIVLTVANAAYYVNLLWPLGLSNYLKANFTSPINGDSLFRFASTGGWTLGEAKNGGTYFNKLPIVDLTASEEARVVRIARSTYRPCCNNSTFFQDCNHGSALFGLLQLGASQGLRDDELFREALAFNSFWFPYHYLRTALFFKVVKGTEWAAVDPREVMGFEYSAGGPWQENVASQVNATPGLIPPAPDSGAGCGV